MLSIETFRKIGDQKALVCPPEVVKVFFDCVKCGPGVTCGISRASKKRPSMNKVNMQSVLHVIKYLNRCMITSIRSLAPCPSLPSPMQLPVTADSVLASVMTSHVH